MDETDTIRKRYDRVSKVYDFFEQPMETMSFKKWRVLAFQGLKPSFPENYRYE